MTTVHGLTRATYRETLRGLQNDALRLAYNGRPSPGMISLDQLEDEIIRVQNILDNWPSVQDLNDDTRSD
jgi:hypothetical protein